jgi:hypothetical protein
MSGQDGGHKSWGVTAGFLSLAVASSFLAVHLMLSPSVRKPPVPLPVAGASRTTPPAAPRPKPPPRPTPSARATPAPVAVAPSEEPAPPVEAPSTQEPPATSYSPPEAVVETTEPETPEVPVSQVQRYAEQLVGSSEQFTCLNHIVMRESSWNPHAGNSDGSYGVPQALPGDKMASAGSD